MPRRVTSAPSGFSWLRLAYRPSNQEVDAYAHIIANAEGYPAESTAAKLYREAELQLWIWRNETRQRASRTAEDGQSFDRSALA